VSRRASLPGAAELFRLTALPFADQPAAGADGATARQPAAPNHAALNHPGPNHPGPDHAGPNQAGASPRRRGSPRQKHDAKITVYVSGDELLALEHARLALRASHGLVVDRGRVVREAIAMLLADLEEYGENSMLVRRLRQEAGH